MDSLTRCRTILGISADNTDKLALLQIFLDKSREDIELFCRDNFIDEEGEDVFPPQLRNIQEDLTLARMRKIGAEGNASYSLSDESVTFEDKIPETVQRQLYAYRRLYPRNNVKKGV